MSWRLSRRKLERVDAQEQAERARGWRVDAEGWLSPLTTCEAVHLRRGVIRGQCRVGGCRRHVRFDAARWVRHGFGQLEVAEALAAYRCGLTECGMWFDPEAFPFGGPPLGGLLRHGKMTAELVCLTCR